MSVLLPSRMRQLHASRFPGPHGQARAIPAVRTAALTRVWITELLLGIRERLLALGGLLVRYGLPDRLLDHNGCGCDLAGLQRLPEVSVRLRRSGSDGVDFWMALITPTVAALYRPVVGILMKPADRSAS